MDNRVEEPVEVKNDTVKVEQEPYNAFEAVRQEDARAANFAQSSDPVKTAKIRELAIKYGSTRFNVENNFEDYSRQFQVDQIVDVLHDAPETSAWLNDNPLDAPIVSKRAKEFADVEKEWLRLRNSTTEGFLQKSRLTDAYKDTSAGFRLGLSVAEEGALYAKYMENPNNKVDEETAQAYKEEQEQLRKEGDTEGFFGSAANFAGTMIGGLKEGARGATYGALAGSLASWGAATGALATPLAPAAALFVGGATIGAAVDSTYKIEAGQQLKTLLENGVPYEQARWIASGVGSANALVEMAGIKVLGAAYKPIVNVAKSYIAKELPSVIKSKTMADAFKATALAYVGGGLGEVATETWQEMNSIIGESIGSSLVGKEGLSVDEAGKRLADTAIATAKGMAVLGLFGSVPLFAYKARQVKQAEQTKEFFTALEKPLEGIKAEDIAPDVSHEIIARQADANGVPTLYIDAEKFNEVVLQKNLTANDLQTVLPGITQEELTKKALNKEDIEIKTADYAMNISNTDFGTALIDHIRTSPDALSAADAKVVQTEYRKNLRDIISGNVSEADIDNKVSRLTPEERQQFQDLSNSMLEDLANTGAYRSSSEARANAKYGAWLVTNLAKRTRIPMDRLKELAPRIVGITPDGMAKFNATVEEGGALFQTQIRQKAAPKKTVKAYKLFRVKKNAKGQIFPLFVGANDAVPIGVWVDAVAGERDKKEPNKVKSRINALHYRPGWHASDSPVATHIGSKSSKSVVKPDLRSDDEVWAEVEISADKDYQPIVNERGRNKKGEIVAKNAELDTIPTDGYYRYKTNPNMTGDWIIGGSMKVNRILSDAEVEEINSGKEIKDLPRAKPFDEELYGFGSSYMQRASGGFRTQRTLDNMSASDKKVFDAYMDSLPKAEKKRILGNLKKFKDTPWASHAIASVFVRQAFNEYLNGRTPKFASALDGQTKWIEAAKKGIDALLALMDNDTVLSHASKAVNNINGSFLRCDPSLDCANYCYAATGNNYGFAPSMIRSEITDMLVEYRPREMAKYVASAYKGTPEFAEGKALRLFDKGDGWSPWLDFIDELNKLGVRIMAFSKKPEFVRKVSNKNVHLLSIDNSNIALADANQDLPVAYVYSSEKQIPDLQRLYDRGQIVVVLPVKLGKKILDDKKIAALKKAIPGIGRHLCPVDAGIHEIGLSQDFYIGDKHIGVLATDQNTKRQLPIEVVEEKDGYKHELLRVEKDGKDAGTLRVHRYTTTKENGVQTVEYKDDEGNKIDKVRLVRQWACTQCDVNGGVGCYYLNATNRDKFEIERIEQKIVQLEKSESELNAMKGGLVPMFLGYLSEVESDKLLREYANRVSPHSEGSSVVSGKLDGFDWDAASRDERVRWVYDELVKRLSELDTQRANLRATQEVWRHAREVAGTRQSLLEGTWGSPAVGKRVLSIAVDNSSRGAGSGNDGGKARVSGNSSTEQFLQQAIAPAPKAVKDALNQMAFHTSPFLFDKFTLDHIGEGEGEQVHGWGLYFALDMNRMSRYRNMFHTVKGSQVYICGKPITNDQIKEIQDAGGFREIDYSKIDSEDMYLRRINNRIESLKNLISEEQRELDSRRNIAERLKANPNMTREGYVELEKTDHWAMKYDMAKSMLDMFGEPSENKDVIEYLRKFAEGGVKERVDRISYAQKQVDILQGYIDKGITVNIDRNKPITYTVDIPSDAELLRSGLKLSEQNDFVKSRMKELLRSDELKKELIDSFKYYTDVPKTDGMYRNDQDVALAELNKIIVKAEEEKRLPTYEEIEVFKFVRERLDTPDSRYSAERNELDYIIKAYSKNGFALSMIRNVEDPYKALSYLMGDKKASLLLNKFGIKGLRYLGATDGECAVIWDTNAIKILEYFEKKNKELKSDIENANANAPRGSYQPSTNTITLTPNCDESTFAHEMGHWYLESLINMSTVDGVAISVKEDVKTILNEFGLDSVDAWGALSFQDREILHERFASWVEDYLATGKAPTKHAEGFFRRLGAFIRKAYRIFASKTREALNERYRQQFGMELPELSDEMKRVLDRMIASEDDLLQAEQAEGIQPLFDSKPEDMSDAQWEQLQYERDEAENEGVEKIQAVRMKDEKWYTKARSSTLRKIQQQGAEVRDSIRKEVEDSVNSMPGVVAYNAMKQGGKNVGIDNMKFDPDALSAAGFNAVQVAKLRSLGLCKIGGMTPSAVRSALQPFASFDSDKKMVAAIVEGSNKEDLIEKITTRRCLKEHSELFNEQKRDALITEALHNEARGRMIAHELAYLANDKNGRSRIFKEAARRTAMDIVSQSPMKNVTVKKFLAAESRASRQAFDALKAGNRAGAIVAKRAQLVNHEAALMAIDLEKQIRSLKDIKTRIFKADKKLAKTHDIDIINVARYVMTNNGIGATMPEDGDAMTAVKFVEKMEKYDPTKYELFRQIIDDNSYKGNVDFFEYKAGDALRVIEDVKSLYRMAAEAKSVYLEGKKLEREAVIDELNTTIANGGYKEYEPGTKRVVSSKEKAQYNLMGILAKTARVENFCRAMDGGSLGAFSRYIYNPIATAASKYRNENAKYQKRLANLIIPMQKAWADVRDIEAPELGYTFATKAELIGAILHTGNKSNKTKLLAGGRGRNNPWCTFVEMPDGSQYIDTTKWDTFFSRICNDGTITQQDMNVVQAIWDSLEDTKVLAQKAFKQMYGYNFEEVEATELVTPWKTYRGGYIPAKTEKYLVAENQTFEKLTESGKEDYLSMMPVKKPGFSESRVERYTKPLVLDVGMVSSHIAEVMRFSMIAPTATEVAKILSDKSFKESMDAINPHLISELIAPWLKRSYEQKVSTGDTGFFSKQINKLRSLAGMGIMAGHIANAMQQVTGFSVALSKVKAKSIAKGFREYVNNKHLLDDICEMSPFMKSRIEDFAYEYQSRMEQITRTSENFSQAKGLFNKLGAIDAKLDPVRDWVNRHAYFLQVAVQAPVDGIVWTAAYNEALEKGLSTEDAIADADSVVRTTQSDFSPENIANVEAGSAHWRAILVFYNYFGMQANLLGERWQVAKQNKNYGQFALDAMYVAWIPSVLAAVIAQMWTGFDTGDDDEWDLYDTLRLFIAEPLKNVIAMIPFGSALVNSGGAFWAKNTDSPVAKFIWGQDPFVGKPLSSPAVDLVYGAGKALYDVYRLQNGDNVNARTMTRDMLDLGSVVTRLPLGGLKKPLGYAAGVASGDIKSDGAVDTVRGFIAGKEIK